MSPNEDIKTFYILYGDGPNTGLGRSFSPRKESHETINLILLKTTHDALYSHGYTAKLHSESSSGLGRTGTCPHATVHIPSYPCSCSLPLSVPSTAVYSYCLCAAPMRRLFGFYCVNSTPGPRGVRNSEEAEGEHAVLVSYSDDFNIRVPANGYEPADGFLHII